MLIASVKRDDNDFASYIISVKDFAKSLGLSKNNSYYQRIASMITGLQKKVLTITDTVVINNKIKERVQKINWLSYSSYIKGEGKIELCFHPKLKPYLLNLKERFTSYKFKEIAQLKSRFSVRIYELLKQYENLKKRTFKLDDLRKILKIEPDQYKPYFNFKNRVILIAQRELNDNASITFDFEEIKVGRKVGKLRFYIKENIIDSQNMDDIHNIIKVDDEHSIKAELKAGLLKLLPEQYKDKASVKKLVESYLEKQDYDYVARNIAYTNDKSNAVNPGKNMHKKSNYRNYLKKALEKDFGLAYIEDLEEKAKEEQLQREAEELKRKEEAIKKGAEEAQEKIDKLIQDYIKALSDDEYKILEQESMSRLKGEKKEAVLNKKAGSNILLKVEIKKVVKERLFK